MIDIFDDLAVKATAKDFYYTAEQTKQYYLQEIKKAKRHFKRTKNNLLPKQEKLVLTNGEGAKRVSILKTYGDKFLPYWVHFKQEMIAELKTLQFAVNTEKAIQNALTKNTPLEQIRALNNTKSLYKDIIVNTSIDVKYRNQYKKQLNKLNHTIAQIKENGTIEVHPPLMQKIQWNTTKNALPTLLNELLENGLIDTTKANIQRLILNNFVDAENLPFGAEYVRDVCNPSKHRKNKVVVYFIDKMAESLKK